MFNKKQRNAEQFGALPEVVHLHLLHVDAVVVALASQRAPRGLSKHLGHASTVQPLMITSKSLWPAARLSSLNLRSSGICQPRLGRGHSK